MKEVEESCKNDKHQEAGLCASRPSRQPVGAVKAEVEQMAGDGFAVITGIGFSENDHVSVVGRGVKSHGKPKAAGSSQCQAPEKTIERNAGRVDPVLMRFEDEMDESEDRG